MQTPLFDYLRRHIRFDEITDGGGAIDVMFLLYDYVTETDGEERYILTFDRAVGTSHSSLMTHTLYQKPPDRSTFTDRILERLA